jgi:hypothetical protein
MAGPDAPRACLDRTLLPIGLLVGALDMEPDATIDSVQEVPECLLEAEHLGAHHGLVASERGDHAVWAVWGEDGSPHLVKLLDCPGTTTDACSLFDGHLGRHSADLYDPLLAAAASALARLPQTAP